LLGATSHSLKTRKPMSKSLQKAVKLREKRKISMKTKQVANEESKQSKIVDSPELENNKDFFFSRRNFYPRQHALERKKFNPFDYFSNNYLPSKVSPRKNQVTMAYYNLAEQPRRDAAQFQNKKNDEFINTFYNFSALYYKDPTLQRISSMKNENLSTKSTSPTDLNLTKSSSENTSKKDSSNSLLEESKCDAKKTHFVGDRETGFACDARISTFPSELFATDARSPRQNQKCFTKDICRIFTISSNTMN